MYASRKVPGEDNLDVLPGKVPGRMVRVISIGGPVHVWASRQVSEQQQK